MKVRRIIVEPAGDAWTVRQDGLGKSATFASGAQAEAAARAMGERFASEGDFVQLKVMLRDGKVGGRYLIAPNWDGPSGGPSLCRLAVAA